MSDFLVGFFGIFGGCCSNVYALEAIVRQEASSGMLITFTQFLLVTLVSLPSHLKLDYAPAAKIPRAIHFKERAVPVYRWIPNVLMFFAVNLLNNMAFGYHISVPVHIILRSGGSVLTMLVGWIWGKRYSRVQVASVLVLTIGIIVAAMADAKAKGKTTSTPTKLTRETATGLFLLFIAQLLSAIMGLYVQATYTEYGNSHWHENLFYSHALSLPLFLPLAPAMTAQYQRLQTASYSQTLHSSLVPLLPAMPSNLILLAVNSATQYACIRGVNILAARTSAVGVSIALNVRKLVSLGVSIVLFGNILSTGVLAGAVLVFASAAVWAAEQTRLSRQKSIGVQRNGSKKTQ